MSGILDTAASGREHVGMCGRFTQKTPVDELARALELAELPPDLGLRYNIAPSQPVLEIGRAHV